MAEDLISTETEKEKIPMIFGSFPKKLTLRNEKYYNIYTDTIKLACGVDSNNPQ